MEPTSFHDWREWRRFRAVQLARLGWVHRDIADALGISEQAVSQWLAHFAASGVQGLVSHPHGGQAKLTDAKKALIPDFLWHGPEAYGFEGEFWTCARVAKILHEELGVSYHKHHVARILRSLGWTPQVPITRAVQRDEEAIELWRQERWPELQRRARKERRTLVFTDESGFYLLPAVVRTYGPKGLTPVLYHWAKRDHLSVAGAVTTTNKVYTMVRRKALNGLNCVEFLQHLLQQIGGSLLVIWDGSPIHRRAAVKDFVTGVGEKDLVLETLPSYAPDLNPVEWLWKHLKHVELRNRTCMDLEELHMEFHIAVGHIRQKPLLIHSFFQGPGLATNET
jgi:transposase